MEQKLLSRYELIPTLIDATSFEVVFIKKNGKERIMKCLFESTRYIEQGVMTVFDLVKQQYRSINFKTLSKIIVNDLVYQITFKGKFMLLGNRREHILEKIQEIIGNDISVLNDWSYDDILDVYDELEQLNRGYDSEAAQALFEYAYEIGSLDFKTITDVIQGNLEFVPAVTMEQMAEMELFSITVPTPDYINTSYIDYRFSVEDIQEYYYEASNGVLQIKKV